MARILRSSALLAAAGVAACHAASPALPAASTVPKAPEASTPAPSAATHAAGLVSVTVPGGDIVALVWCDATQGRCERASWVGAKERVREVTVAPDGRAVAFLRVVPGHTWDCRLEIVSRGRAEPVTRTPCNPNNSDIDWTPGGRLVHTYGAGSDTAFLELFDATGHSAGSWDGAVAMVSPTRRYGLVARSTTDRPTWDTLDVISLEDGRELASEHVGSESEGQAFWRGDELELRWRTGTRRVPTPGAGWSPDDSDAAPPAGADPAVASRDAEPELREVQGPSGDVEALLACESAGACELLYHLAPGERLIGVLPPNPSAVDLDDLLFMTTRRGVCRLKTPHHEVSACDEHTSALAWTPEGHALHTWQDERRGISGAALLSLGGAGELWSARGAFIARSPDARFVAVGSARNAFRVVALDDPDFPTVGRRAVPIGAKVRLSWGESQLAIRWSGGETTIDLHDPAVPLNAP